MLSELPPTPAATSSAASTLPPPVPPVLDTLPSTKSPKKTSRKPTHKVKFSAVLKGPSPKKTRASRRSSGFVMSPLSPQSKSKNTTSSSTKNKVNVIPPFETEVIPPALLTKSTASPEFRTTIHADCTNALPSMSEAFVLPPPSPAAKLPPLGSFLTSTKTTPPLAGLDLGIAIPSTTPPDITFTPEGQQSVPAHLLPPSLSFDVSLSSTPAAASPLDTLAPAEPVPEQSSLCVPSTPVPRRPSFPVAKPFAQHMIHAYSPVKPSPLSRILSMADSPEERAPLGHSGPRRGLDTLMEEGQSGSWGISPIPAPSMPDTIPAPLLQGGYGDNHVDEEDDESPLLQRERLRGKKETSSVLPSTRIRTKSTSSSNNATRVRSKSSSSQKLRSEHGRVVAAKKTTAPVHSRERTSSKSRHVASSATTTSKARVVSGGGEKENDKRKKPSSSSSSSSSSSYSSTGAPPATKRPSTSTERALPPAISTQEGSRGINAPTSSISRPAPAPVKKGGARRVPIDSAEAAPTGTAWRG